jgi:phosphoribosylformylglycinamidine synthase I
VSATVGVVVFPGSNCEQDCARVFELQGAQVEMVWHRQTSVAGLDILVLPGGFAHGDYLRTGAIAGFSPVMDAVRGHARAGGLVIGICNGFQILCEAGLLPGALRKNSGLKFMCKWTDVRVENNQTPFTSRAEVGQRLRIPINHFEGNWYCDQDTLRILRTNNQIALRYEANPNGSLDNIAGIVSPSGNVLGLMPHPERACDALLGSEDGGVILGSMLDHVARPSAVPAVT